MALGKILRVIYKITSPSGSIYIGQTKDINDRIYHYKSFIFKLENCHES